MKAMVLNQIVDMKYNINPLELTEIPEPVPGDSEVLIKVKTCGVCHTELDEIEGRTPPEQFPRILGHQIVGEVIAEGESATRFQLGDRVGVAWIYSACGECKFCQSGQENLCPQFMATGRDINGGYAEYVTVQEAFAHPIPQNFTDAEAAPHLCAGAIGYRSLSLCELTEGANLGLTGFGASAHLVLKLVTHKFPDVKVFVFSRTESEREFARYLGAYWAGDTLDLSPDPLDCIIDTTPVWKPVVEALRNLAPGGRLVINAIRKEKFDQEYLLKMDYSEHLWMEKEIKSVANVTRKDVSEFLDLAAHIPIRPEIQEYPLEDANRALQDLKNRRIRGAKVLCVS